MKDKFEIFDRIILQIIIAILVFISLFAIIY